MNHTKTIVMLNLCGMQHTHRLKQTAKPVMLPHNHNDGLRSR